MKNKIILFILFVILISLFHAQQVNAEPNSFSILGPIVDILNDLSGIIVGNNTKTGIEGVVPPDKLWLVVLGTAFMLSAILFAVLNRIKLFDNLKGAKIIIALGLAFMTVALSPLCAYVATIGVAALSFVMVAALIFLAIMTFRAFGQGNRAMAAEGERLQKELLTERKGRIEAQKDEKNARQDLEIMNKEIMRENQGITEAENIINGVRSGTMNIQQKMQQMSQLISQLGRISRDSPEAMRIKQSLLNEYKALLPSVNDETKYTKRLEQAVRNLREMEKAELKEFARYRNAKDIFNHISERIKQNSGGSIKGILTTKFDAMKPQIDRISNQIFRLLQDKEKNAAAVDQLIQDVAKEEENFTNIITDTIQSLEQNNINDALGNATKAMNLNRDISIKIQKVSKDFMGITRDSRTMTSLIAELNRIINTDLRKI